jgi:hypothetical protein
MSATFTYIPLDWSIELILLCACDAFLDWFNYFTKIPLPNILTGKLNKAVLM